MKNYYLSVVVPCYNEMVNLPKGVLEKIENFLKKKNYTWEVIVVDDGSTDGSLEFLTHFAKENPEFKILRQKHRGKAGAVTQGVLAAQGSIVLFSDMDQATPIEELDKLLPYFDPSAGEYDVVIGSRASRRRGAPWTRVLMAKGMIILRSLLVGLHGIGDTQCGFKAFKREVAQKLFKKMKLYSDTKEIKDSQVSAGFDVELLYLARKENYKIKEVPVEWSYVETRRVNPLKDSWYGFWDLVRIRLNDMYGVYK